MLKVRIIPCLDVKDGKVVKGVQFKAHEVVGDILGLAERYSDEGADELVFYDITASADRRKVDYNWIKQIASQINIPFCVAGGIRSIADAAKILENGADKISINSPALENPDIISEMSVRFGKQCVVVGIDSFERNGRYMVHQYTGDTEKTINTGRDTFEWAKEAVERGAGEIVLNCMNMDGVRNGYDLPQLAKLTAVVDVPVVASGGAGTMTHFQDVFEKTGVTGALAATVFHKKQINIGELKAFLKDKGLQVRR
ncbi:imidazole glycerol phosphate synthase subunit HisF [Deferribacterales bacterium RsTz2092]|nr:imidazole glycerol phosphate synthase subunit HisF [Deferribacterales bacterium]